MAVNIGASADPSQIIREIMGQLMQPAGQPDFSDLDALLNQAQQRSRDLTGQVQQERQAPEPSVDPTVGLIMRALAGTGEALSGGTELTQGVETREKEDLTERRRKRAENLSQMIRLEEGAAKRAEDLGDTIAAAKSRAKVESLHKNYENMRAALGGAETLEHSKQEGLNRGSEERRANIMADARLGGAKLAPEVKLQAENLAKRIADMEDERAALLTKRDRKGKVPKNVQQSADVLMARIGTLEGRLNILLTPPAPAAPTKPAPADPNEIVERRPGGVNVTRGGVVVEPGTPTAGITAEQAAQNAVLNGIISEAELVAAYTQNPGGAGGIPLPELRAAFRAIFARQARGGASTPRVQQ